MNTVKVSVIVPVYRTEKYIRRCLESLLAQTLSGMEIIVVDDKGGDGAMDIVRDIKRTHPKGEEIVVVEMPRNSGVAAARNEGLKRASGKYVAFVDSDDWCETRMYACLYEEAERVGADWCYSEAVKDFMDGHVAFLRQPSVPKGEVGKDTRRFILTRFVALFSTALYRREFLLQHGITFPPYRFSEDSFFVWMVAMHAQVLSFVPECFYHYVMQAQSVSHTFDPHKEEQKTEVFTLLLDTLEKKNLYVDFACELDYLFIKKGFLLPLCVTAVDGGNKRQVQEIFSRCRQRVPNYKKNPYYKKSLSVRFSLGLFNCLPALAIVLFRVYARFNKKMVL